MTEHRTVALDIALAYHRAWTSHDFERAMTYIAVNIICQAPAGRLDGAEAFRGFMGPFAQILTRANLIAAFGDDTTAVLMYDAETVPAPMPLARNASPSRTARSCTCESSSTACRSTPPVEPPRHGSPADDE